MKKQTFHMLTRLLAGIGAALIMVGAAGMLPQNDKTENTLDIYASASGIRADAVVMTVDGQDITAQEYLYYVLNYGYQYYSYYAMNGDAVDWAMPVDEGSAVTLADLIKTQAQEAVVQDAVIRKMASDNGIVVTQERKDAFQANIEDMKAMYAENYQSLLMSYGLTEKLWELRNDTSCLSGSLQKAYTDGDLRPDAAALEDLIHEHGLVMARSVFVSTAYLEGDAVEEAKATAEEYYARILNAEDMNAEIVAINTELGLSDEENIAGMYHCGHDHGDGEEDSICVTLESLKEGELSQVVETEEGFYLLLREKMDMDTAVQVQFSEDVEEAVSGARIIINTENMEKLNVGAFVENYMAALALMKQD